MSQNHLYLRFFQHTLLQKFSESNFHVFEVFDGGNKTEPTDVYVVGLKDGQVHGPYEAPYAYSGHHINAYEKSEENIVIDFCPTPWENFREYLKLENMLNPPETIDWDHDISTTNGEEATRFTIDMGKGMVTKTIFPNTINSKFINTFDFPTINEEYRGKKYCITYGVTAIAYSRVALVKKNICDSDQDKVKKESLLE